MAMPTRSARLTEFGEKAPTPVAIGPGSYLGPTPLTKPRPSLAAFASSQNRSWQETPSTPAGPGPGSYGSSIPATPTDTDARPSYCFESRAPRLAPQYTGSTPFSSSTVVQVPGPGTYETQTAPARQYTQREIQRGGPRQKSVPGTTKRFNPPSVPRKEQSFGYNVDSRGKLLALPAPSSMRTGSHEDCAGPGDYNPLDKDWWAGVGASKFSKGARKTLFDEEWAVKGLIPGPGDYDPKLRPRYHMEMPGSSPFMSGVPKGEPRLQPGPGPGQYIHHDPLGINTSASNVPCLSSSAQRGAWLRSNQYLFLAITQRVTTSQVQFTLASSENTNTSYKVNNVNVTCNHHEKQCPYNEPETGNVPGPGAYVSLHDNSSFSKVVPKTLTDERIGFSSTGKRSSPGPTPQTAGLPGPGQYDLDMQSIMGNLKSKSRIGRKGVFGSSGDRFRIRSRTDMNGTKTQMQLWDQGKILKRVVILRKAPKSTSSFRSETSRFRAKAASGDTAKAPPAARYVRKDSFDYIVEKGMKSKSKPFMSTSDKREGGAFSLKETENIPGPGAYNITVSKSAMPPPRSRSQTKSRFPQGARFHTARSQSAVGPGSHEIAGSLIKKTFNVTFNGASTPAGSGRIMHRTFYARKDRDSISPFGSVPPVPPAGDSSIFRHLDVKEGFSSPGTFGVPTAA